MRNVGVTPPAIDCPRSQPRADRQRTFGEHRNRQLMPYFDVRRMTTISCWRAPSRHPFSPGPDCEKLPRSTIDRPPGAVLVETTVDGSAMEIESIQARALIVIPRPLQKALVEA